MGDKRRFDLFARFIAGQVPEAERGRIRVADVAAGRGALSFALREHGFKNIVPFEMSPRRGGQVFRLRMQVRPFTPDLAKDFQLIVGMHPDAATDCILDGAAKAHAMAIVCPCCVRPSAWTYWGNKSSYGQWHAHLKRESARRGLTLNETTLSMSGARIVFYGGRWQ